MGGFAFDLSANPKACPLPFGETQVTLTLKGIQFLADHEPQVIPDISVGYIRDKSKANHLAKTMVGIQAAWFCCSTISRLAYGLGISLLELNTFSHAICALLIYLLWWNKPLDVEEPVLILVVDQDLASLCALLCVRSKLAWRVPVSTNLHETGFLKRWLFRCFIPEYANTKVENNTFFFLPPDAEID